MYHAILDVLRGDEFTVVDSLEIPSSPARFAESPRHLYRSKVGKYLDLVRGSSGLWSHQAEALEHLGLGQNVVISTGTASGKSLVFQSHALHTILSDDNAKVLVFYPLLALSADQCRSWEEVTEGVGLSGDIVGRIDGSVPVRERDAILEYSRIVLMTPDVCQAWLMSRIAMPIVRQFVSNLALVVMDEAHTLEGVFGSNFAFLVRRITSARTFLRQGHLTTTPLQFVAATATIDSPSQHLQRLTGAEFVEIDHETDGAPRHHRIVAHIASPEGEELSVARALQRRLIEDGKEGAFLTFVDSRKGVESLAMATQRDLRVLYDDDRIAPYRSGYVSVDRRKIEEKLRSGSLSGVVSTSALEAGIDFQNLTVGFSVGLPPSRKSYRQRLGRVGRNSPGAFVFIGSPGLFRKYGTSLREYHEMSVEPSYLYLENRFMQFAHARCLVDEREAIGAPLSLAARRGWPSGFGDVYLTARPGADRPQEFDAVAEMGGDNPQRGYPLRTVGEANYEIKFNDDSDKLGDVTQSQALRECYPGASYFHLMKSYEVTAWRTSSFQPFIQIKGARPGYSTRPQITTWVNTGIRARDLIEGHLLRSDRGFLAESQMSITERVNGYVDLRTGAFHSYQDLQQKNPNMKSRTRNLRTTGVVICVDEEWFKEDVTKRLIADKLRELFCHEYSILVQDIGAVATNIAVHDGDGRVWRNGCIAVFDQTQGSLRLTESLFSGFDKILARLTIAADSSEHFEISKSKIDDICRVVEEFAPQSPFADEGLEARPRGFEQVFTPGSIVCYREKGFIATEVEIIRPTIMDGELKYQVRVPPPRAGEEPMRRWVSGSLVEPSADSDSWDQAWWNRETEEYEADSTGE